MRPIGLLAAWLVATVIVTAFAWQVVAAAENHVSDPPKTPVVAIPTSLASTTSTPTTRSLDAQPSIPSSEPTTVTATETPTTAAPTTTTLPPTTAAPPATAAAVQTPPPTTEPPTTSTAVPTTSTAVPTTTTTSTTLETRSEAADPSGWRTQVIQSPGGEVTISSRSREVRLEAVTPAPGWSYEIDEDGRKELVVEFDRDDTTVEVKVRWSKDGSTPKVDIEVDDEHDD